MRPRWQAAVVRLKTERGLESGKLPRPSGPVRLTTDGQDKNAPALPLSAGGFSASNISNWRIASAGSRKLAHAQPTSNCKVGSPGSNPSAARPASRLPIFPQFRRQSADLAGGLEIFRLQRKRAPGQCPAPRWSGRFREVRDARNFAISPLAGFDAQRLAQSLHGQPRAGVLDASQNQSGLIRRVRLQ